MKNKKLIDYARNVLRKIHPLESVYPEQAAEFGEQLRDGCRQDMIRLIETCLTWGLPDCDCKKRDCVYCSRGFAQQPQREVMAG